MKPLAVVQLVSLMVLLVAHTAVAAELEPKDAIALLKSAVPAEVEISIVPNWNVGDAYRIEATKEQIEQKGGVLKIGEGWSTIDSRVIAKTSEGFMIEWKLIDGGVKSDQLEGAAKQGVEELLTGLLVGMRYEFVTESSGMPTRLLNFDEVQEHLTAFFEQVAAYSGMNPQKQAQLKSYWSQAISPQVVEQLLLVDAKAVYGLMGGSYRGGAAESYEIEMPFPLGGTVRAKLHTLVRDIDRNKNTVRIDIQTVPDSKDTKAVTKDMFASMALSQGIEPPKATEIPEFFIQDTVEYVHNRTTGIPDKVAWEKFIRSGDSLRIDRRTYRILPAK